MHKTIALFGLLSASLCVASPFNLSYIFPKDMHGFFGLSNRNCLQQIITTTKPSKVVEIGTWLGVSAIFMAKLLPEGSHIYCVDPWVNYADMQNMPECQERMSHAYERFLSNCIHHEVTHVVIPMRMRSLEAVAMFNNDVDLIYIDGSHKTEDVFNDIMAWWSKLSPRGIMCGDDIGWPSVHTALKQAAEILNVTIASEDNFWWFIKN